MAFTEIEIARINKVMVAFIEKHRPPPHIRPKLDLGYRLSAQSIEIFERRPRWRGAPGQFTESSVAKATLVKATALWKVYWKRADLKWHAYPPVPSVGTLEKFLDLVAEDKHSCFFG